MAVSDPDLPYRPYAAAIGASAVILAGFFTLSMFPGVVESQFTEGIGTAASRIVGALSSTVPFSLAEWVELGAVAWILLAPLPALLSVWRKERSLTNAALSGILQLLSVAGLALILFYGLWGLNYARAPAAQRLGWEPVDLDGPGAADELAVLSEKLVARVNGMYRDLHDSDDIGSMSTSELDLEAVLDAGWERAAEDLGLHATVALSRGPAKPLLSSPIWSYLGIGGFYFPFTGEANYNRDQPQWQQTHTIAHEKAHQRGIASEDEANFFGFIVCIQSDDPFVQYGGWLFAQRRILSALMQTDPERGIEIVEKRLPGVQRDVDEMRAFWLGYSGVASDVGAAVNDAYLRANRVEGGISSYSLSARLIVGWTREDPQASNRLNNL